ncbi:MAG TPA: hypothetical protein PKY05_00790 [Fibrobacteria bacterium]|nr:hypothetical protein [Fibrobacteria bacterium]
MNAVEIEKAVSDLAEQPFDGAEFPYAFLEAFGNKDATIKRLRAGDMNRSDVGGVLQQKNIHLLVASSGDVGGAMDRLRASERNERWKVRFLLATDGLTFEAEDLETGETVACAYGDFPDHFGFFLPLAGISPYLVPDNLSYVQKSNDPIGEQAPMLFGNMPRDGGHLFLDADLAFRISSEDSSAKPFIKRFVGSDELINGKLRYCLWIDDDQVQAAQKSQFIQQRLRAVTDNRMASDADSTRQFSKQPHRFVQIAGSAKQTVIVVPRVSSENRPFLPVDYLTSDYVVGDRNFALYDAPLWNMALIASRLHWVWIGTVCVRMRTDFSYSNTLGWNTFPVPFLTEKNKADLTRCAEDILLAREAHFPATIADLYDPETMPANLREAHERNDETLERIYIGRRFKNDTERLEKLFDLYTKMTAASSKPAKAKAAAKPRGKMA